MDLSLGSLDRKTAGVSFNQASAARQLLVLQGFLLRGGGEGWKGIRRFAMAAESHPSAFWSDSVRACVSELAHDLQQLPDPERKLLLLQKLRNLEGE